MNQKQRKQKQGGNRLDSGYHGDRNSHGYSEGDSRQGQIPLDDFNNAEDSEIYTPVLPKAESMEEVRYSSPEPVSWSGNQVVPASAEVVQRAELNQSLASHHDNTRAHRSTAGQWAKKKEDFIIGGKLLIHD